MKHLSLFLLFVYTSIYSNGQNWKWAMSAGGREYDYPQGITTDNAGNIYIVGSYNSPSIVIDSVRLFNADSLYGTPGDIFIAKLDSNSRLQWARSIGASGTEVAKCVAIDKSASVYIGGYFNSATINIGSFVLTNSSAGTYDAFVAKYDAGGNVLWAFSFGENGNEFLNSIATDTSNNVYITGTFSTPIILGSSTLTNVGREDIYFAKLDSSGLIKWAKKAGGASKDISTSVTTDKLGNVFMAGYLVSPTLTFDTIIVSGSSPWDSAARMFLVKYNSDGIVSWVKSSVPPQYTYSAVLATSVCVDNQNNIYVAGSNGDNLFLVKQNQNGDVVFLKGSFNASGAGETYIAPDSYGNVYMLGSYWSHSTINFDSLTLTPTIGLYGDICFVRFDSTGTAKWARNIGNSGPDVACGIAIDPMNNVCLLGRFHGDSVCFDSITIRNYLGHIMFRSDIFIAKLSGQYIPPPKDVSTTDSAKTILVFPNPVHEKLTILSSDKITYACIFNIIGQKIFHWQGDSKVLEINVSNFSEGNYFIRLNGKGLYRFVKL